VSAPQIDELYTIGAGGNRRVVHPADVRGKYTTRRRLISAGLVLVLLALPFIQVNGLPSVWIDVARRRFHFFGASLGPTDSYLLFFLITGVAFALIVASALWGRVWCGYACPQTVFLETVFRNIERWIEGSREQRMRLADSAWTWSKLWRRGLKLSVFFVLSAGIAHVLLCYFVSPAALWADMQLGPSSSPFAFGASVLCTAVLFFNFTWFREQLCIIICPYGRLQSALSDADTVVIGYDALRGEPRGKVSDPDAGACVSCNRCVTVCPTAIDIRHGLQLECVGCANCIDACDEIMIKVGRAPGLIRYDSQAGFAGQKRTFWRPRVYLYSAFALVGLIALTATLATRPSLPATLVRQSGAPFVIDGDTVRNAYALHLHNRRAEAVDWTVVVTAPAALHVILPRQSVHLEPYEKQILPLFVEAKQPAAQSDFTLRVGDVMTLNGHFLAPTPAPR